MKEGPQQQILEMIRTRKQVRSREIIREVPGWDFRKAITRLQRQGHPIVNLNPPGIEACYAWMDGGQMEMF